MTTKEAAQIIKEHNRKDDVYATLVPSSTNYNSFLKQCKRAVNKMQGIPDAKVDEEFFSQYATDQSERFYKSRLTNSHGYLKYHLDDEIYDNGKWVKFSESADWKEYKAIPEMSNWEYLRKYGELCVQDGWFCVDFEFGNHVFAALSQKALVEMGVFSSEDCKLYLDALDIVDDKSSRNMSI